MKKQLLFLVVFFAALGVSGICVAGCENPACDDKKIEEPKKIEEIVPAEDIKTEENKINEEEFSKFAESLKEEKPGTTEVAAPALDESKKA